MSSFLKVSKNTMIILATAVISVVAVLVVVLKPFSTPPSSYEAAAVLLDILQTKNIQENIANVLVHSLIQQKENLSECKKDAINDLTATLNATIGFDSLKEEITQLYADSFTVEELQSLTAFYQTALGQKTLKILPELAVKTVKLQQKKITQSQTDINAATATAYKKIKQCE